MYFNLQSGLAQVRKRCEQLPHDYSEYRRIMFVYKTTVFMVLEKKSVCSELGYSRYREP